MEAGRERLAGKEERQGEKELRRRVGELERALGRKTYELEIAGKSVGGLGVSVRVARSRRLVAEGYALAAVARVMQVSRQALYRTPTLKKAPQRRPVADPVEQAIVEEALANQTDGYRMVCAFVRRRLGVAVNRKRASNHLRRRLQPPCDLGVTQPLVLQCTRAGSTRSRSSPRFFDWRFVRANLHQLMLRLSSHEPQLHLAA